MLWMWGQFGLIRGPVASQKGPSFNIFKILNSSLVFPSQKILPEQIWGLKNRFKDCHELSQFWEFGQNILISLVMHWPLPVPVEFPTAGKREIFSRCSGLNKFTRFFIKKQFLFRLSRCCWPMVFLNPWLNQMGL